MHSGSRFARKRVLKRLLELGAAVAFVAGIRRQGGKRAAIGGARPYSQRTQREREQKCFHNFFVEVEVFSAGEEPGFRAGVGEAGGRALVAGAGCPAAAVRESVFFW